MTRLVDRRKVIVITDGDRNARRAVEVAARRIKARCISASEGNPTTLTGPEILELIKSAPYDPVVVMVDDKGNCCKGAGEQVLEFLSKSAEVEILGAVAVASNIRHSHGIQVDCSIGQDGQVVGGPVNKAGLPSGNAQDTLKGDTVEVLTELDVPVIVGTGDTGKMEGKDRMELGAPITTKAFQEILHRHSTYQRKEEGGCKCPSPVRKQEK
ncbi:MAG TPA: stage V sporulation protein AE [Bacillota bacterium]|nr:stage V sporulation protein AE [Bacillota bacterium]